MDVGKIPSASGPTTNSFGPARNPARRFDASLASRRRLGSDLAAGTLTVRKVDATVTVPRGRGRRPGGFRTPAGCRLHRSARAALPVSRDPDATRKRRGRASAGDPIIGIASEVVLVRGSGTPLETIASVPRISRDRRPPVSRTGEPRATPRVRTASRIGDRSRIPRRFGPEESGPPALLLRLTGARGHIGEPREPVRSHPPINDPRSLPPTSPPPRRPLRGGSCGDPETGSSSANGPPAPGSASKPPPR